MFFYVLFFVRLQFSLSMSFIIFLLLSSFHRFGKYLSYISLTEKCLLTLLLANRWHLSNRNRSCALLVIYDTILNKFMFLPIQLSQNK